VRLVIGLFVLFPGSLTAQSAHLEMCGSDSAFVASARLFATGLLGLDRTVSDSTRAIAGVLSSDSLGDVTSPGLCARIRTQVDPLLATSALAGSDLTIIAFAAFRLGTGFVVVVNTKAAWSTIVFDGAFYRHSMSILVNMSPG
jgi:hypothetical protein